MARGRSTHTIPAGKGPDFHLSRAKRTDFGDECNEEDPRGRHGRGGGAAAALSLPAVAPAATVTITNDAGAPQPLAPGAPLALRNLSPMLTVTRSAGETFVDVSTTGPGGPGATSSRICADAPVSLPVSYQANGTYTVVVASYTGARCTGTPQATAQYQFTMDATIGITGPTKRVLRRAPNDFTSIPYRFQLGPIPGASSYDVHYLRDGVINPATGDFNAPADFGFAPAETGFADISFREPGTFAIIGRAAGYSSVDGPWSAPFKINVRDPFDLLTRPFFLDGSGPSYKVRARMGSDFTRGKVTIKIAKGRKGKFRSFGKARIRNSYVLKRFTLRRAGSYRLRIGYKGSKTVAPGRVTVGFRITNRSI